MVKWVVWSWAILLAITAFCSSLTLATGWVLWTFGAALGMIWDELHQKTEEKNKSSF